MKLKKVLSMALVSTMALTTLIGCGGSGVEQTGGEVASLEDLSGEITFITHRTDLKDTLIPEYIAKFNEQYPNVVVKVEAMTNYENDIKVRMNTTEYGDVLMIPNINKNEYSNFFIPLGTEEELSEKYRNMNDRAFDGNVYGIASMLTAPGILYNQKVFDEAGITEAPKTVDDYIAAMKQVKDKTDAIPYYTNYADQWPLTQWASNRLAYGDTEVLIKMGHDDAPFAPGTVHYEMYRLMYDLVKEGLVEEDPMTTNWELSKQMIADGEIGSMVLGNWAVSQVKALAENPDDICYMPFPITAPDGKQYAEISSDYAYAVNKNSKNQEAALAFLWWMVEESGYAEHEFSIPVQKDAKLPETLNAFEEAGVQFLSLTPAPAGEEDLFDNIDNMSEVGTWQPKWKLVIIEAALGNRSETYDEICEQMNADWATARTDLGVE